MSSPLSLFTSTYWNSISDPRTSHLPFMSISLLQLLCLMSIYLFSTTLFLPHFMKSRRPFNLKSMILTHNILMVLANAFLFMKAITFCDFGRIFLSFDYPSQQDISQETMHYLLIEWIFWMTRFMDLADTVFFVLRKKQNNVTFLHLYHHSIVPVICWMSLKVNPMAPIVWLFGVLNSLIHVLMYLYYALATFGPRVQRYLWWKRYLTQLQIAQFLICGLYGILLFFKQTGYPMGWFIIVVGQNPLFFYMFYHFYKNSYKKRVSN